LREFATSIYHLTENMTASLAWMHGFRNAIQGLILQIPGSTVRLDAQVDTLWAGVTIKFGGKRTGAGGATASSSPVIPPPVSWSSSDVPATSDAEWPEIPMPSPRGTAGAPAAPNAYDPATTAAASSADPTASPQHP
jgi:hypothetical protein